MLETRVHVCVWCFKFKRTEEDFWRDNKCRRGYSGKCKECVRNRKGTKKRNLAKFQKEDGSCDKLAYARNYARIRGKIDINFRLRNNIRGKISKLLRGYRKSSKTLDKLLGCTIDEWKTYLEERFKDGMTWDNYGEWHVDHIIPCSWFNMEDETERKECFHYTNTQPLWASENLSKQARFAG